MLHAGQPPEVQGSLLLPIQPILPSVSAGVGRLQAPGYSGSPSTLFHIPHLFILWLPQRRSLVISDVLQLHAHPSTPLRFSMVHLDYLQHRASFIRVSPQSPRTVASPLERLGPHVTTTQSPSLASTERGRGTDPSVAPTSASQPVTLVVETAPLGPSPAPHASSPLVRRRRPDLAINQVIDALARAV